MEAVFLVSKEIHRKVHTNRFLIQVGKSLLQLLKIMSIDVQHNVHCARQLLQYNCYVWQLSSFLVAGIQSPLFW